MPPASFFQRSCPVSRLQVRARVSGERWVCERGETDAHEWQPIRDVEMTRDREADMGTRDTGSGEYSTFFCMSSHFVAMRRMLKSAVLFSFGETLLERNAR